jgi:hypothetical protein
MATTAIDSPLA